MIISSEILDRLQEQFFTDILCLLEKPIGEKHNGCSSRSVYMDMSDFSEWLHLQRDKLIEKLDIKPDQPHPVIKPSLAIIPLPLVKLTDEELKKFAIEEQFLLFCDMDEFQQIASSVQDALIEKNQLQDLDGLAHELWAAAQLVPGECIVDRAERIKSVLKESLRKN